MGSSVVQRSIKTLDELSSPQAETEPESATKRIIELTLFIACPPRRDESVEGSMGGTRAPSHKSDLSSRGDLVAAGAWLPRQGQLERRRAGHLAWSFFSIAAPVLARSMLAQ